MIDPASAALEGATNDSGPVRRFMDALRLEAETSGVGVLVVAHDTKSARSVLYLRHDPVDRDRWLLECVKANYGRTGWGAQLEEAKTDGGKFCGFAQSGQTLTVGEVKDLKTSWKKQLKSQRGSNKSKAARGKARATGELPDFMYD